MTEELTTKVVWTLSINRKLAQRVQSLLPKDDLNGGPKKGSRSQLIEGLLKAWADKSQNIVHRNHTLEESHDVS